MNESQVPDYAGGESGTTDTHREVAQDAVAGTAAETHDEKIDAGSPATAAAQADQSPSSTRRWQPLGAIDRRVVGVLAEKAKTTPDVYPMSVNAICTGCNQKSNRDPLMQLEPADVEESLERLRAIGAVGMVEGYGRVTKYRHYLYEWLGVDKVELAVMTELLLRGPQTLGELRARASRMEPIADLAALRAICDSLKRKGLVVYLTPEGRGQIVTHALYPPRELENIRARYAAGRVGVLDGRVQQPAEERSAGIIAPGGAQPSAGWEQPPAGSGTAAGTTGSTELHRQLAGLSGAVEQMREQLQQLAERIDKLEKDVQGLKNWIEG